MTKTNDKVENFLLKNKIEIDDNGFSEKVMTKLPRKKSDPSWITPIYILVGIIITLLVIGVENIESTLLTLIFNTPIFYLAGYVLLFLISFFAIFLYNNKRLYDLF
jgi:hypothetical protein